MIRRTCPHSNAEHRQVRRRLHIGASRPATRLDGSLAALANDAFDFNQNGPQVALDVLANDVFDSEYRASG